MTRYLCPACQKFLERDPEHPFFTGRSYCEETGRDVKLVEVDDGE